VNGDGCNATCDSDESCGNSVIDVGAGEVCDDGNTMDGDDCSADCRTSLLCGNGEIDAPEECDDGGTTDGDGCSGTCLVERCGNGRVDAGEDCDDANADDTDGCTASCAFTCSGDADCADADVCNGAETCTMAGTVMSRCAAGMPAADGTSCGPGGRTCMSGVCTTAGCGDGTVTAPEECDDGNIADGDGCDSDCTWTCDSTLDCSDDLVCNGAERCVAGGTLMSECRAGTPRADGFLCDRDMMPGTRDICRMATCLASACGDGFVDAGATPVEQCDDGNTTSGDGCSATCTTEMATPPTGFRVTNLDLISPRITADIFLLGCRDVTQTAVLGFSVNGALDTAIQPMSAMGDYDLHIVNLMRPLNPAAASTPAELHLDAVCDEATMPDSCGPDPMPMPVLSNANNQSMGSCFTPVAADVNTRVGTPAAYAPTANTVSAPCFVSDEEALTVTLSGIDIPLTRARVSATYSGTPANRLVSGTVIGFLSETAAADVILPDTLPVVGGDSLYQHLQAGNRSVMDSAGMTIADGCNVGGGMSEDDADMDGATRGFWFFLNFEAELITWTGP
jgi:cysteine-rich repeat protein